MRIVASVQARLGSTRLPGKVLYHLGDRTILGHVVKRTEGTTGLDSTVVAVGDEPPNDAITQYCDRCGLDWVRGPEDNLLERHLRVCSTTDSNVLVRITGDCPFLPSGEIERVVEEHRSSGARYTTNYTEDMPIGTAVDAIDRSLLDELATLGEDHPVRRLREEPGEWDVAVVPSEALLTHGDEHVAVDTPEDYWRLTDAVEAVGTEPTAVLEYLSTGDL